MPEGVGYRLLCELRHRGVSVHVEGGALVNGRLVGGKLVATPGQELTDIEQETLVQYSHEIRALLPYMLGESAADQLTAKWEEKARQWQVEQAYLRLVEERKLLGIQAVLGRATPEQLRRLEQLSHIKPPDGGLKTSVGDDDTNSRPELMDMARVLIAEKIMWRCPVCCTEVDDDDPGYSGGYCSLQCAEKLHAMAAESPRSWSWGPPKVPYRRTEAGWVPVGRQADRAKNYR